MAALGIPEILAKLERVAQQLEESLTAYSPPYSHIQELQFADQVDHFCRLMTDTGLRAQHFKIPKFTPVITRLILCRIRDAQLYVRSPAFASMEDSIRPATVFRELLVDWWHEYAEPFYLDRRRQNQALPSLV
jgi:hypothetical protein